MAYVESGGEFDRDMNYIDDRIVKDVDNFDPGNTCLLYTSDAADDIALV